jgi:hypothetical protein
MESGNKSSSFVQKIHWELETKAFLSYKNYTGNCKQILFFRTRTTLETGNKYFSFVQELHWKLQTNTFLSYQNYTGNWEEILFFRTRTTLETGKKLFFRTRTTLETGNKYFSFVPELHWKLHTNTFLSYQNYTGN